MSSEKRQIHLGFTAETFPAGTHMCYIYNDDDERHDLISKFIESGVAEGEAVHYFCHGSKGETLEEARRRIGVRLPEGDKRGSLSMAQAIDVYCPDGAFIPQRMLDRVCDCYQSSVKSSLSGARASGEMAWALDGAPGTDRLIEYEALLNTILVENPCTALCQYDARRFDGATLFQVLAVHPAMVVQGRVARNPYYVPPEKFLAKMRKAAA
jgi:hypothetical protein